MTRKRLAERLAALDRDIEAYGATLETNDAAEGAAASAKERAPKDGPPKDGPPKDGPPGNGPGGEGPGGDVGERLKALLAKRAKAKAELAQLEASGETQLSRTDGDARLLSKSGQVVAGYNVQIAVDERHKLIVASDVVNDGNDTGQLHAMALAAKAAVGARTLTALADSGYYNGETLKACEADAITAYVPQADRGHRLAAQGRFTLAEFTYDAQGDVYRCPAGAELKPTKGYKRDAGGKLHVRYACPRAVCAACPLRRQCLTAKARRRDVYRWEHEAVIERHRARMAQAGTLMRRRGALAEHPFGTLKCRAGYRHFLMRGFDKVRGEWSLMALCYNFTRVLTIIGIDRFVAYIAKRALYRLIPLIADALIVIERSRNRLDALGTKSQRFYRLNRFAFK